jgi:hypothetical protein
MFTYNIHVMLRSPRLSLTIMPRYAKQGTGSTPNRWSGSSVWCESRLLSAADRELLGAKHPPVIRVRRVVRARQAVPTYVASNLYL